MGTYDTIGGTPRHDPIADETPLCEICGKHPFDCTCPICPICGQQGNPNCLVTPGRCEPEEEDNTRFI